jgi:arsenate reductase-like glutaredoxin family protein
MYQMEKYLELFKEGITKEEFTSIVEKVSQASSDKVRTEYSQKIAELETKIPRTKSEQEIDIEEKLRLIQSKEQEIKLVETLQNNQLPIVLAKFLKSENLESIGTELGNVLNELVLNNGYKPTSHKKTESTISKEQFTRFTYQQRVDFSEKYPELYKQYTSN